MPEEEKYHWVVLFRKGGKVYPYMYRTMEYMTAMVEKYYAEHGSYPYLMFALVGEEMKKVVIS